MTFTLNSADFRFLPQYYKTNITRQISHILLQFLWHVVNISVLINVFVALLALFRFYCSCLLSFFSHSTLEGFYVDDALQGQGVYTYEDGGVLHGTYVDGELNGPAQEFDGEGRSMFKGQYKDNIRCGECWVYYPVSWLKRVPYSVRTQKSVYVPEVARPRKNVVSAQTFLYFTRNIFVELLIWPPHCSAHTQVVKTLRCRTMPKTAV